VQKPASTNSSGPFPPTNIFLETVLFDNQSINLRVLALFTSIEMSLQVL
jgi:hypothetical protein